MADKFRPSGGAVGREEISSAWLKRAGQRDAASQLKVLWKMYSPALIIVRWASQGPRAYQEFNNGRVGGQREWGKREWGTMLPTMATTATDGVGYQRYRSPS